LTVQLFQSNLASGCRSRKKPPVGPPFGKVASQTGVSAPCSVDSLGWLPPKFVRTHPGLAESTRILLLRSSDASITGMPRWIDFIAD
jgi:hypothetical protein